MTDRSADPHGELPPRSGTYRLGVFGGMFDPPHVGHLRAIEAALATGSLDRVIVVPAGLPPHRDAPGTPARRRLALAVRAFADMERGAVSDTEVDRGEHGEVGYMVDTLEELAGLPQELGYDHLAVELTLLVGADQLRAFTRWHRWERILQLAELGVFLRPGETDASLLDPVLHELRAAGGRVRFVPMEPVDASSTQVRAAVRAGDVTTLHRLVPPDLLAEVLALYP